MCQCHAADLVQFSLGQEGLTYSIMFVPRVHVNYLGFTCLESLTLDLCIYTFSSLLFADDARSFADPKAVKDGGILKNSEKIADHGVHPGVFVEWKTNNEWTCAMLDFPRYYSPILKSIEQFFGPSNSAGWLHIVATRRVTSVRDAKVPY